MCGIIGFLDKRPGYEHHIGRNILGMLQALSCRGPDSVGVAFFAAPQAFWVLQIKLPEGVDAAMSAKTTVDVLHALTPVFKHDIQGAYLRAHVTSLADPSELEAVLLAKVPGTEIVSLGHQLEIVKQVGSPAQLEKVYGISHRRGSHAIAHTRLSTESKVDLSHSQPFWAHGIPDLATVHNGHVTNYHKLRRQYEQRGYHFFTENDSEVIGIYLRDRLAKGSSFEDALRSSMDDLDGSYCYLAATGNRLAYVRDSFGFKPLVIAETDNFVAIATEEIALRRALGNDFEACEPPPGTMKIWAVGQESMAGGRV